MNWLFIIVGLLAFVGIAIAVWERKRGRVLLQHDLNEVGKETEADRETMRAKDLAIVRTYFSDH